jgi:microcystin-dependent protein
MSSILTYNNASINGNIVVTDDFYQSTNGILTPLIPTGSIIQFGGSIPPTGWLLCNGQEISKTTYPNLYNVIGDVYGSPFFSTNFVLPDLRGRTPIGNGNLNGTGTSYPLGSKGGSESHVITISEMPSHTHTGTISDAGNHTHNYQDAYFAENGGHRPSNNPVYGTGSGSDYDNGFYFRTPTGYSGSPYDIATSTAGSHTHTITNSSTGSGVAFRLLQPYVVLSYIIRY